MHVSTEEFSAASQLLPSPFIVASTLPSPTHAASICNDPETAVTPTTVPTTTIHMDSDDTSEEDTNTSAAAATIPSASDLSTTRINAGAGMRSNQRTAAWPSLSTHQLASVALRRLPARPAPTIHGTAVTAAAVREGAQLSVDENNTNIDDSEAELEHGPMQRSTTTTPANKTSSPTRSDGFRNLAPPPPLQSTTTPSKEQSTQTLASLIYSPTDGGAATSSSRFQVPPLKQQQQQQSSTYPSQTVDRSPHKQQQQQQGHQRHAAPSSFSSGPPARYVSDAACSKTPGRNVSQLEEVEEDEEEEDVALRVLASLQQKDEIIQQLTQAMSVLEGENAMLRRRTAETPSRGNSSINARGNNAKEPAVTSTPPHATPAVVTSLFFNAAGQGCTPEAQRAVCRSQTSADLTNYLSHSPSLPPTPVRWWKEKPKERLVQESTEELNDASEALETAHISSMKSKKAINSPSHLLAAVKALLVSPKSKGASQPSPQEPLSNRFVNAHADEAASPNVSAVNTEDERHSSGDNAAITAAALEAAQARVAQLEYQLDTVHEERREEQRMTRDHIEHLTRELHDTSRTLRRQERRHKEELSALQQEVAGLADQLEDQLRAANAKSASSSTAAAEKHAALQRQLHETRLREEKLKDDYTSAQRQWREKLEEQKQLLEAAREAAQSAEAEQRTRTQHEAALLEQLTQQQQHVEAQVQQWKVRVTQAQRDLSELRVVHQRTEETVAVQRAEVQELTEALATATLQHTHDEQRAEQLERHVELLRQQLRDSESTLAAKEAEISQLRQERAAEVERVLLAQDSEQRKLLKQVEGCMKGSEAVESALLEAEANRRDVAAQLSVALRERDEFHRTLRDNAVQMQAQLLEQQQLFQEGQEVLQQRLREAKHSLSESNGALDTTQRELKMAREKLQRLEVDNQDLTDQKKHFHEQLQVLELSHSRQTADLVKTKEALKDALHAQLTTTSKLKRTEHQVRGLREAAQRADERRAEEHRALQRVVTLLWKTDQQQEQQQQSAGMSTVLSMGTQPAAQPVQCNGTQRRSNLNGVQETMRSVAQCSAPSSPSSSSRSSSRMSATTESVAMSAVNMGNAATAESVTAASSIGEEAEENGQVDGVVGDWRVFHRRGNHRPFPSESPSLQHAERHANATANETLLLHSNVTIQEHCNRSASHSQSIENTRDGRDDVSMVRTLAVVYNTIQQLLTSYNLVAQELSTKRNAVRILVKERKAQHAALAKAQEALEEQRKDAGKFKRAFTKALRAEAKTALEDLKDGIEKQHAEELANCLAEETQRHENHQREIRERFATRLCTRLMDFVKQLPTTMHATLSAVTMPAAVKLTREAKEAQLHYQQQTQQQQRALWPPQPYAADGDTPYCDYPSCGGNPSCTLQQQDQQLNQPYANATDSVNSTVSNSRHCTGVAPEVKEECDQIAREVLGLAGGWWDLSSAAAAAAAAALDTVPLSPSPACAHVMPRGHEDPLAYGVTIAPDTTAAAESVEVLTAAFALHEPMVWPAKELAELEEVVGACLKRFSTHLDDADGQGKREETEEAMVNTTIAVTPVAHESDSKEKDEQPTLAMGLRQWMKSLRQPNAGGKEQTRQQESSTQALLSDTAVAPSTNEAELLVLLLNACVVHVVERVLRGGAVHVTE